MSTQGYCEAENEMIGKLWTEGKSASEVAAAVNARFKRSRSRNAVIGRIHRMGLAPRGIGVTRPVVIRKQIKPAIIRQPKPVAAKREPLATGQAKAIKRPPAATPQRSSDIPPPLNLDVLQLTDKSCRYAVTSDLPHAFCGHPVEPGRRWCAGHSARVFSAREVG